MISLCTVSTTVTQDYLDILCESILRHTKHISEVLIAKVDAPANYDKQWTERGVLFREFGMPILERCPWLKEHKWGSWDHAVGLHECLDRATKEYIHFCDPDIFFYSAVDELYLDLKNKYDLSYVGVSHVAAPLQAHTYFPSMVNALVKKADLPGPDFLKGYLKYRHVIMRTTELTEADDFYNECPVYPADGMFLIPNPIKDFIDKFPNKDPKFQPCTYDGGCNLYLWHLEKNWKWLSFQTPDCHLYTTAYYRSNCDAKLKMPKTKILWHAVGASLNRPDLWAEFKTEYEKTKEDEE